MDDIKSILEDTIERITSNKFRDNIKIMSMTVKSINTDMMIVEVQDNNNISNIVPLRSFGSPDDFGFYPVPKVHSFLTILQINFGDSSFYHILNYSFIDKFICVVGDNKLYIDTNEIKLKHLEDVNIECKNVNINTDENVYINTNDTTQPLVRGANIEERLNKLYDFIKQVYDTVQLHVHPTTAPGSPTGVPTVWEPFVLIDKGFIDADKGLVSNIKSTKNFTE